MFICICIYVCIHMHTIYIYIYIHISPLFLHTSSPSLVLSSLPSHSEHFSPPLFCTHLLSLPYCVPSFSPSPPPFFLSPAPHRVDYTCETVSSEPNLDRGGQVARQGTGYLIYICVCVCGGGHRRRLHCCRQW